MEVVGSGLDEIYKGVQYLRRRVVGRWTSWPALKVPKCWGSKLCLYGANRELGVALLSKSPLSGLPANGKRKDFRQTR
jgi:hypothetical protein